MADTKPSRARNQFSKVVGAYAKYRRDYPEQTYNFIYKFCPDKESKVLDVGCGTGIVTKHLADYYQNIAGTDKEGGMIEVAKQYNTKNLSFIVTSAENLPFRDNSFDLVTVAAAYHWFDYDLAGKEIYRVLKPDGKLCVFWKYAPGKFSGYLPPFAQENLRKLISIIPQTNKEPVASKIFLRVGFTGVKEVEFDFDDIYTKEEILGYVQSHSTFNLLDNRQKEEYIKLNEQSVESYLKDGQFTFKSRITMWLIEK